ncbi:MAG: ABC transporter ATP-binding protein/permease [Clostridia bacterium]|nr:ABC transporter ATP-binding protein/permease [Clostridia bacterium]
MIGIRSLNKYFNKGKQNEIHVINDVSLELPDRGMVAIFGKSGCGKTTLLNVIGGLDSFGSGSLTIEGKDIRSDTDRIRNKYIGYIFQNYNLNKSESCFDNVADALRLCGMTDEAQIEERVMAALANVDMDKYRNRTPDTLSGGQQQRIAIARAIVKNPRIILADEPTGNLDEANTVMIMDLLRQIAKDHLVLLVTHEANLVDFYCDTVVELSDGRVVSIKQNAATGGYAARDKNHIYLGELEKSGLSGPSAEIEYYGDTPEEPVRLKIINNGGKLYVQINTKGVQVLDEFSEIKLKEGVYESRADKNSVSEGIDMSKLPPVEGSRFGHLFSLGSSVKSGYVSNFKNRKKGKKVLRGCMCLFAAVVVFMSAVFGTVFSDLINAGKSYNHNVFYVYTPDGEVSAKLNAAVGSADSGIDYVRLMYDIPYGDSNVKFYTGFFETFESAYYDESFRTNAVYLDMSLGEKLPLVAGKNEGLATEEILVTTAVADELLELSSLGYITEYKNLIGLITNSLYINGMNLRIAGVVESDESAIYLTELAMAKYVVRNSNNKVYLGSDISLDIPKGETVLAIRSERADGVAYPKVGETVIIEGRELKVAKTVTYHSSYEDWLVSQGIKKDDAYVYFLDVVASENPSLSKDSDEFANAVDDALENRYYEFYDYYYADIVKYFEELYMFDPDNTDLRIMFEHGGEEMKYMYMPEDYYKAVKYKEQNGRYPTQSELERAYNSLPDLKDTVNRYYDMYNDKYYYGSNMYIDLNAYFVSDEDYIGFSKQTGETHDSAKNYYYTDVYYPEKGDIIIEGVIPASVDIMMDYAYPGSFKYTVIHSTDPEKTEAYLLGEFSELETPYPDMKAVLTPDGIFKQTVQENSLEIIAGIITLAVILAIMSVCMYFIMRSSLMNRIKEIGIYRAIGVSKKNLVFKFFIEAVVLTTLTVFIGYLAVSAFLFICLGASPLVSVVLYYPLWMAGAILVILYALSLFCGTLPIMSLLRKTPSAIIAKYDI